MEWSKEQRADYIATRLSEQNYPTWGRAAKIAELCNTSHSQATNWMNGAVPRDHDEIKRIASLLNLDIMNWVYGGTATTLNRNKLMDAIMLAKTIEQDYADEIMSPYDFAAIVMNTYDDKIKGAAVLESLAVISDITKRGATERNGTED